MLLTMESSIGAQQYRNVDEGMNLLTSCDFTSYSYFSLAIALFTVGTVVTVYALDVSASNSASLFFNSLGHVWLVGPLFISSGLMIAVKTILYLRKKTLLAFILRQRALLRELHNSHSQMGFNRNPSSLTLPPSYDLVVGQFEDCPLSEGQTRSSSGRFAEEAPPPSYEEAILLLSNNRDVFLDEQIENTNGNERQFVSKDDAD